MEANEFLIEWQWGIAGGEAEHGGFALGVMGADQGGDFSGDHGASGGGAIKD